MNTKVQTDIQKIDELLTRGVDDIIHKEDLRKKLLSGKQLRIKLGIDPTSTNIHLGRSVPLLKLRDFQELGHTIVCIVGDFTGVIGDTSDKESERPMLTKAHVEDNQKTYRAQISKILDSTLVEFYHNSEWLEKLTYREIGEHANLFSVSDFIARDNIKKRLDAGKKVSLRETLYPLMQGYDSVATHTDVELGGTDQRFNMLAGRVLQTHFKQEPQNILMTTLINGTDGRKMSSSWGNTINLSMNPIDMYGKIMSMRDSEIVMYCTVCTRIPMTKVAEFQKALNEGVNPRDIKMKLAYEITRMYHSEKEATEGEQYFINTFQQKHTPENILEITTEYTNSLIVNEIVTSKSELRRLLEMGGVRNMETGEKLDTIPDKIEQPLTLKIGKRRFVRLLPS
jgi:tyrosyl-tRNA synthetase